MFATSSAKGTPVCSQAATRVQCGRLCGMRRHATHRGAARRGPHQAELRVARLRTSARAAPGQPENSAALQTDEAGADGWKALLGDGLWAPAASGNLKIGALQFEDLAAVADIQAAAFHTPVKLGLLNAVAYNSFRAEIREALGRKFKYGDPERFCCLVAKNGEGEPIGVVEVSLHQEQEVLARLAQSNEGAVQETYAYISSMAVREQDRRSGVASAMLSAAEQVAAARWGQAFAVLDVHEDNSGAVRLYESARYQSNSGDPGWVKLVGKRKRLHMQKALPAL